MGGCAGLVRVAGLAMLVTWGGAAWATQPSGLVEPVQYRDQYRQDGYRQDGYRQDGYQRDQYQRDDRQNQYRQEQEYGRGQGRGVVGGSYQRSCSNIQQDGSMLRAVCQGGRGRRFETSIDLNRCGRSDIGNDNGTLNCASGRGTSRRVD